MVRHGVGRVGGCIVYERDADVWFDEVDILCRLSCLLFVCFPRLFLFCLGCGEQVYPCLVLWPWQICVKHCQHNPHLRHSSSYTISDASLLHGLQNVKSLSNNGLKHLSRFHGKAALLTCCLGKDGAFLVERICRVNGKACRCKECMDMHAAILLNCLPKNRRCRLHTREGTYKSKFLTSLITVDCSEKQEAVHYILQ